MKRYAELHCNDVEVRIKSLAITKLASALEDLVERTVAGRGSTGGTFPITIEGLVA